MNKQKPNNKWWRTSIIWALLIVIWIGIALSLPQKQGLGLIILGIVIYLVVLLYNPRYRYMRVAISIVTAMLASHGLPKIVGIVSTDKELLAFSFDNNVGWQFDISCGILATILFILDYKLREPESPSRQLTHFFCQFFSSRQQKAEQVSQQIQIGDITGDNNVVHIQNNEARKDFNPEIDTAASFLKKSKPDIAIEHLERLKRQYWDRMSDRERFRILANMGHAYSQKDQHRKAAKFFIEAKGFQENDEQALALEAAAHLYLGDDHKARQLAEKVLERFPSSEIATAVMIKTIPDDRPISEVMRDIPSELKSSMEVLGGLFSYAFRRDDIYEAIDFGRQLVSIDDTSIVCNLQLASALVRKASLCRQQIIAVSSEEIRSDLMEAIKSLTNVIKNDSVSSKATISSARYYRAIAYDFSGNDDLAEADFRAALECPEVDKGIYYQFGLFLIRQEKTDEALVMFEHASTPDGDIGPSLLRAKLLIQSSNTIDQEEAIHLLEELNKRIDILDERDRFDIIDALVSAYLKCRTSEDADLYLTNEKDKISDASYLTIAAAFKQSCGDSDESKAFAQKAAEAIQDDTPKEVSFILGNLLAELEEYDLAVDVLKPITTCQSMDSQINLVLECARQAEDFSFIIEFCKELRITGNATPFTLECELIVLERLSNFGSALSIIEEYLNSPGDEQFAKVLRVRKSMIGKRLGREELVEYSLQKLPSVADVPVQVGVIVAMILSDGENPLQGAEYAYELLRNNYEDSRAHRCLVEVLGVSEDVGRISLPTPDKVAPGCAVRYSEEKGDDHWVILEDSDLPNFSRNEIAPDSYLGKELIDKKIGDEFYLRRDVVQNRIAKIDKIINKMEYRKWDILDNWEDRFHEEYFVRKYEFPKTPDGDFDVHEFLKSLERLNEGRKQIDNLVQEHSISASIHAQMANLSILESVLDLSHDEKLPVRCCRGTDEEYTVAYNTMSAMQGVVIEGSALATLYWTGVFKRLDGININTLVTARTVEIFINILRDRYSRFWSKNFITMGRRGAIPSEKTDETIDAAKTYLQDFISWIEECCEVRDATSLADFSREKRDELTKMIGPEATEAIALARSEELPLWTDDFIVADLSKEILQDRRLWSELMFEKFTDDELISLREANQFKVSLIDAGYHFTRVNKEMVEIALEAAHWDPTVRPLSSMIKWLNISGVKQLGALQIGCQMLAQTQKGAALAHQKSTVFHRIVQSLSERSDGIETLNYLLSCLNEVFSLDPLSKRECIAIIQQELVYKARERRVILPGDTEWFY